MIRFSWVGSKAYLVADDGMRAEVDHMANCIDMPTDEWRALNGQEAVCVGSRRYQVGRAVITVRDGYDHRPDRKTGPYGVAELWEKP